MFELGKTYATSGAPGAVFRKGTFVHSILADCRYRRRLAWQIQRAGPFDIYKAKGVAAAILQLTGLPTISTVIQRYCKKILQALLLLQSGWQKRNWVCVTRSFAKKRGCNLISSNPLFYVDIQIWQVTWNWLLEKQKITYKEVI